MEIPSKFSKVSPKGDLVLLKVTEAEEKTTGGILLPGSAQKKPTAGSVVEVGDGRTGTETRPFELNVGETVVYSKFGIGVTDLAVQGVTYALLREDDVIGVMPNAAPSAADVPNLRPLGDRVLLEVDEQADVTVGGVILPSSAKERPMSGTVVATGAGKFEEGKRKPAKVKPGDRVLYFKYAGDAMETPEGKKYIVVHDSDILCKQT